MKCSNCGKDEVYGKRCICNPIYNCNHGIQYECRKCGHIEISGM